MHRYITEEEFNNTKEGSLLVKTMEVLDSAIDEGILKNCKLDMPVITDEKEIIDFVNNKIGEDSDYMYYISVTGHKNRFNLEAETLKGLILELSKFEGLESSNGDTLIHVNSVSVVDEKNKDFPYIHHIIFLFKVYNNETLVN